MSLLCPLETTVSKLVTCHSGYSYWRIFFGSEALQEFQFFRNTNGFVMLVGRISDLLIDRIDNLAGIFFPLQRVDDRSGIWVLGNTGYSPGE